MYWQVCLCSELWLNISTTHRLLWGDLESIPGTKMNRRLAHDKTHISTHCGQFRDTNQPNQISLDCRRAPENLDETQANSAHKAQRPGPRLWIGRCEAEVLHTEPQCWGPVFGATVNITVIMQTEEQPHSSLVSKTLSVFDNFGEDCQYLSTKDTTKGFLGLHPGILVSMHIFKDFYT